MFPWHAKVEKASCNNHALLKLPTHNLDIVFSVLHSHAESNHSSALGGITECDSWLLDKLSNASNKWSNSDKILS